MKIQVMWDVTACAVVNSCRRIGGEYSLHFQGKAVQEECCIPQNAGTTFLRKVGNYLPVDTPQKTYTAHASTVSVRNIWLSHIFSEVPSTFAQKGVYVLM